MRYLHGLLIIATTFILLAFSWTGEDFVIEIESEKKQGVTFSNYLTYGWESSGPRERTYVEILDDVQVNYLIKRQIQIELEGKGYQFREAEEADLLVSYESMIAQTRESSFSGGLGGTQKYESGFDRVKLVITLRERKSKKEVWSGSAEGRLLLMPMHERREERINDSIEKIIEQLPG